MIYVFFASGFEEIEGLAVVNILRRAKLAVTTVGIGAKCVTGSHNITVCCDTQDDEVSPTDSVEAVILPGGMPGTKNLESSACVQAFIDFAAQNNRIIAAICAAPSILGHKGLLDGREVVCFPGFEKELGGATVSDRYVCVSGNIITAKGMGASIDFAIAVAAEFIGPSAAASLRESLQCPC